MREIERDRGIPSPFEEEPSDIDMVAADSVRGSGGGASREHCANPSSVGDIGWVTGGAVNIILRAPAPTSLYSTGHKGPPTIRGLDAPDQGASQRARQAVGLDRVEINLTFSPVISTFTLNFILSFYLFYFGSAHRACFIVTTLLLIESDSHNTLLCFETNSLTFGPLMIQDR
jgi:hypothetical protein